MYKLPGVIVIAFLNFISAGWNLLVGMEEMTKGVILASWIGPSGHTHPSPQMIAGLRAAIIIFYLVIAAIDIILGVGLFKLMEWARNGTVIMTVLFAMRGVFALLSSFPLHLDLSVILLRVALLGTEIVIIGYLIKPPVRAGFKVTRTRTASA